MTTTQENLQSSKLGTMPVGKLILTMSGPAILSMLVQALYNIVDSVFIGMYDATNGVLALSYAMPMQLLVNAFAIGLAVGAGSLISRLLGEGRNKDASLAAQTGLLISFIFSALFLVLGYFVSDAFIKAYTVNAGAVAGSENVQAVYKMGSTYLTICMCCSFGFMIETMLNRILQAMGNMIVPMVTQLVGAITNIILDPILISVCKLGAPGAAIATVIGQVVAMLIPIVVIIKAKAKKQLDIDVFFTKDFKIKKDILVDIMRVGLPTVVMNSIGSVMYMLSNAVLNRFADAVWAFGVYFKLQSFAFMPVFGLNQGCIPIMGYNYGANKKDRFVKTFKYAVLIAFVYMTFALILFHAMPEQLLKLFSVGDNANRIQVGSEALRLCSIAFIPASLGVIMIAMFNAVGHGIKAMLISLSPTMHTRAPRLRACNIHVYGAERLLGGVPDCRGFVRCDILPHCLKDDKDYFREESRPNQRANRARRNPRRTRRKSSRRRKHGHGCLKTCKRDITHIGFCKTSGFFDTGKEKVFYAIQTISLIELRWCKKPLAKRKY